jgi:hypothetical protein
VAPVIAQLRRKRVWIPLGLFVVYTLVGFFVVPRILRQQIVQGIRQNYKREARLGRVRFNPLVLSLSLEHFELRDPDSTTFVAFDRLFMGFQPSSLVRWAITLRDFRLDGPRVHVRLMPDGRPNFDDLIPKQSGKPPRLVVGRFEIHRGSVRFTNLNTPEPQDATLAPIELDLRNFTTIPEKEGRYHITAVDPGQGTWQWSGELTFEPMHSAGTLEIAGTQLPALAELARNQIPLEIASGKFGCRLQYSVDAHGDSLTARIHDSSCALTGLDVREKGSSAELMSLDSLVVTGIGLKFPEQSAAIGRVLVAGPRIQVQMNPDSSINWIKALAPKGGMASNRAPPSATGARAAPATAAIPVPAASAPSASAAAPAWTMSLSELAVRDLGLQFQDHTVNPPFEVALEPVQATVRNLDSRPGRKFDLEAEVAIAGTGHLNVTGTASADPPSADLDLKLVDLPLPIFQPYLTPRAKLRLVSGTLGIAGALRVRPGARQPELGFKGRLESHKFLTRDRIGNEPFLSWDAVNVNGIEYSPARLGIGAVHVKGPYAKVLIHKDRTTNLQDVLGIPTVDSAAAAHEAEHPGPPPTKHGKAPKAPSPKASEALAAMQRSAASASPKLPIRIGSIDVAEGSADFADLSLILPFAARIEHLGGSVTSLSSDSASRATVSLDGKLNPSGSAQVRGVINPLAQVVFLDLGVVFRDFNMPVLTPYSGEFLGRTIDKGQMSMDLGYRLEGRRLIGKNKILLDQLELGDKVESPEATHLPVGLAIAILKDRDGKIDLEVPVEGDLDDPKFRIGKIIWDFIMSLLKKVATAPFALLGGLFGGSGDELSHVDFEAGSAALLADQGESLNKLALALGKRPQLRLEVRGRSDSTADAVALRKVKFTAMAGERMASDAKKYGSGLGIPTRLLQALATERLGKPATASLEARFTRPAGELSPDQPAYKSGSKKLVLDEAGWRRAVEDTLTALQPVNQADLLALAGARGTVIKQRLLEQGVEEARIFLLDPEPGKVDAGRIRIDLALRD